MALTRWNRAGLVCALIGACTVGNGNGDGDADTDADTDAGGCVAHSQCDSDEFCHDSGDCETVVGREWYLHFYDADIDPHPDGWDFGGGAPDPYVYLEMDNGDSCSSDYILDTFEPTWNWSCRAVWQSGGFLFGVWDSDTADDDLIGAWEAIGLDDLVAVARENGEFSVSSTYITLWMEAEPNF